MSDRSRPLRLVTLVVAGWAIALTVTGCGSAPERLTLFYSLTCQACYEGAQTQAMVARVNALRERLSGTRIEIVDTMIPGSGSRLATMAAAHDLGPDPVTPPVLFADDRVYSGHEKIAHYLAELE